MRSVNKLRGILRAILLHKRRVFRTVYWWSSTYVTLYYYFIPEKSHPSKRLNSFDFVFSPTTLNSKHARMLNVNANWFSFERKVNLGNRLDWREMEKNVAFISLISLSGVYEGKRIDQIRVNGPLVVESNNLMICRRKRFFFLKTGAQSSVKFLIKKRCW